MKKFVSYLCLTLIVTLCLSAVVFAADDDRPYGRAPINPQVVVGK